MRIAAYFYHYAGQNMVAILEDNKPLLNHNMKKSYSLIKLVEGHMHSPALLAQPRRVLPVLSPW